MYYSQKHGQIFFWMSLVIFCINSTQARPPGKDVPVDAVQRTLNDLGYFRPWDKLNAKEKAAAFLKLVERVEAEKGRFPSGNQTIDDWMSTVWAEMEKMKKELAKMQVLNGIRVTREIAKSLKKGRI